LHHTSYPVFFWIHGGAFTQGAGSTPVYNGTDMADRDVVTVIVNYRLGALGYMASESMQGNYGVMDQIRVMAFTLHDPHSPCLFYLFPASNHH
jgi:carboxylesterase type B